MKKVNLIKRLLSYSHEKQSPQRFARYAAMLIMLLTLGVGQMWADWYVAGNQDKLGSWSPNAKQMTNKSGNTYYFVTSGWTGSTNVEYKVTNGSWDEAYPSSNKTATVSKSYFIIVFDGSSHSVSDKQFSTLTVAGDVDILGVDWSANTAANHMSFSSGDEWTLTKNNVALSCSKTYAFKVCYDDAWTTSYPASNKEFTVADDGVYNITFKYAASTNAVSVTTSAVSTTTNYYIFGSGGNSLSWDAGEGLAMSGPQDDYVGNSYYYYQVSGSRTFKIIDKYNNWDHSGNIQDKDQIDNHVMRTDIDLADAGSDDNISIPSAGYIIYYPATHKICAKESLTNLGKPYTITYLDGGGGAFSGEHASGYPTTHSYGTATTLKTASKTGYTFGGWFTSSSCTGVSVGSLGATAYDDDITLYAKWTAKTTTLTIKANGGAQSDQNPTATYDSNTVTSFTKVTKAGSGLDGYYTASSGGVMVLNASGAPVASASDASYTYTDASGNWKYTGSTLTLWAQWLSNVTVTYDANGADSGEAPTDANTYIPDGAHNATVLGNTGSLVKAGYTWSGWNTLPDGSGVSYAASSTITGITSNMTLYAKWVENKETLTPTVDYNGGATPSTPYTATSSNTVGVATSTTLTASAPNAAHYTFAGWTLTNLTVTDGNAATDRVIMVKVTTPGSAIAAEAEYNEVLTTDYELHGGSAFGSHPTNPWENVHAFTKKSGHSTESVAYYTASIASTNTGEANGDFQFKIKNGGTWYGIDDEGDQWWYTRAISEGGSKTQTLSSSGKNIELRADIAGDYEIKVDYSSTPTITITFPTTYQVNYAVGTVKGAKSDPSAETSASVAVADGGYVLSGTSVTFTAEDAKDGYTWAGWYDAATTAGTKLSEGTSQTYTTTISAATTVYAVYTEDMHNVTVNVTGSGTVSYGAGAASSSCTATAGIATASNTIHAIPAAGYAFVGWTGVSAEEKNHITDYTATWNSTNEGWDLTVKADAATTIVANFAPRFALVGAIYTDGNPAGGMPGWDLENAVAFTYSAGTYTLTRGLTSPNTTYAFKIIDRRAETWIWRGYSEASNNLPVDNSTTYTLTVNGGNNVYFDTRAAGDYTFTVVEETITGVKYPNVKIACPTSRQITIGQKSIYDPAVTNTSDATTTGGNVTAEDNLSNTITTGQYVADGANVTFTAHPATGYAFKGWYQDADCTTPYVDNSGSGNTVVINAEAKTLTLRSIAANKAVYAKYEEIMTRIAIMTYGGKFSVDGGAPTETYHDPYLQVGVKTTHTVSIASEDAGHYFSNWELSASEEEDVNFSISGSAEDEDNRSITVTGLGYETRTHLNFLEPKFKQLESIYFRNIFDDGETVTHWENVYVCFDITWADYDGKQAAQTSTYNTSKNLHVQMEGGSNYIYRAYVPRYITRNNKSNVAFVNYDPNYADGTGNYLYNGIACSRGDYCPKHNMFVPYHEKSYDANSVAYYNSGYWMHYSITQGVDAGYWIERRTGTNTYSGKPADQFVIVKRAYEDNPSIQYRLRIDNVGNDKYAIFSEGGLKYKAASTITHSACDGIEVGEDNSDDAYFVLTPTAEGEYIITLDQSGDKMKISVEYPVVRGDYVLEHTYTGRNKANTADSTYTTRTNVIKASTAGTNTRYSMYLNKKGATLKLRKCESINASGEPQWSTGSTTNVNFITDVLNEIGDGVYQFDLTVAADALATVDSVRLYTGNFYIKTDAADGGWVAYKKNILDKNTVNFDRTSATYDNYFCKYFASKDWNIKSVIANDYCNQLSDTVKGDGIARMVGTEPYVPVDGTSIRFSYNSATNETKRAYLGASEKNDFLNLVEDQAAEKVYRMIDATTYDLHNITGYDNLWKTKFADNGNWVYEMDLKVKPSAQAGVSAAYTDASKIKHEQVLIPSTNTVLGGSSSSTNLYSIRIVYDFKTNFMMSAFILDGEEITEALSDFDMLWVRHKDDAAQEVILGTGGSMTNVRVIGAVEFQYNEMYWLSESGSKVDLSSWTSVSRPYLKYFISFPFDVEMNSIFGLNQSYYGLDYVIQKYDGTKRAKEGLFLGDGDNYWVNMEMGDTLKANEGYCLILDNDYASGRFGRWWDNKGVGSSVYLYFPAMEKIASITATGSTVVPEHTCTIDRTWGDGGKKNHMNTDSHWNMIGSPLFCNAYIKDTTASSPYHMSSYYELNYSTNKWDAKATRETPCFKAMSSRFVQWYGTIGWTNDAEQNIFKAPRRAAENENYFAKIEVTLNNQRDYTYLEMIDGADKGFILREDMMKFYNSGVPQICTFAEGYDVAYNKLPVENTTVALGLVARKNGTYTFSMPTNFSGTVTLIDNFAQTRTNLAMEDYEVYLEKGTIDDRFELEINVNKMPTAIDGAEDGSGSLKDGKAHKFIMNGVMYILENGRIYDAQGNRVK